MVASLIYYLQDPNNYETILHKALLHFDKNTKWFSKESPDSDTKWICEKIHNHLINQEIIPKMRWGHITPSKLQEILGNVEMKEIRKDIYNRFDKITDEDYEENLNEAIRIFENKRIEIIQSIVKKYSIYFESLYSR